MGWWGPNSLGNSGSDPECLFSVPFANKDSPLSELRSVGAQGLVRPRQPLRRKREGEPDQFYSLGPSGVGDKRKGCVVVAHQEKELALAPIS